MDSNKLLIKHVLYEFKMYLFTFKKIVEYSPTVSQMQSTQMADINFVNNYLALLESHQIHLRNLLEFFSDKSKFYTDKHGNRKPNNGVRINDIIPNYTNCIREWNKVKDINSTISETVDHLSTTRTGSITDINDFLQDQYQDISSYIKFTIDEIEAKRVTQNIKTELEDSNHKNVIDSLILENKYYF